MDIQKWLDTTADRTVPDDGGHPDFPTFFQPHDQPQQEQRSHRRKRKKLISDSSLIEVQSPDRQRSHQNPKAGLESDPIPSAEQPSADSNDISSFSAADAHVPRKTYEKRARHKTKADRYEIKSKKHKHARKEREDNEAKTKRRKTHHHRHDGGRTSGLVESFQLKNGPKANRLTLKPQAAAGLFSHGRSSAQIPGRGNGLPDLVFNEMRFLQKPREHQDRTFQAQAPEQKRDRKQQLDEEISTYFRPGHQASGEGHDPRTVQQSTQQYHLLEDEEQARKGAKGPFVFPVESVIGPTTKKAQSVSHAAPFSTNPNDSAYSWSDSLPRGPATAVKQHPVPSNAEKRLNRKSNPTRSMQRSVISEPRRLDQDLPTSIRGKDRGSGTWIQTHRARGPTCIEVYCPSTDPPANGADQSKFESMSLPKCPSSQLQQEGVLPNDYRTSDILIIKQSSRHQDQGRQYHSDDKENNDPAAALTSTPPSKHLLQAMEALSRPEVNHDSMPKPVEAIQDDFITIANARFQEHLHLSRRRQIDEDRQVLTVQNDDHNFDQLNHQRSIRALDRDHVRGNSPYMNESVASHIPLWAPGTANEYPLMYFDDEVKPEVRRNIDPYEITYNNQANLRSIDDLEQYRDTSLVYNEEKFVPEISSSMSLMQLARGQSIEREYQSKTIAESRAPQSDDQLAGFWKPHILY